MTGMKVKTILVSQPEPKVENSPYAKLIEKENIKYSIKKIKDDDEQ